MSDLSAQADAAASAAPPEADHKFQLYGYTDLGLDRVWGQSGTALGAFLDSYNATSFVIGNLDLYMDAQPVQGWRSLVEVRFTNAPQGQVTGLGGLGGGFSRVNTRQVDPNASTVNQYIIGGYTVIERAQIDWTDFDFFKVRAGLFLTPFGIWNMDHGTPTLISLTLPQALAFNMFPSQQTGIMVSGSRQAGPWELGYMGTVSNGRQELQNFSISDGALGFGARLYANNDSGNVVMKFGVSGYTDAVRDQEIDLTGLEPATISTKSTFSYREFTGGLDVSLDIGPTRIRSELVARHVQYDKGLHEAGNQLTAPGSFLPNRYETSAYLLVAHQLPVLGLEPFAVVDSIYGPLGVGDFVLAPSIGLNIHFNGSVQLKTQFGDGLFFDLRKTPGNYSNTDVASNDVYTLYSRLVLVF